MLQRYPRMRLRWHFKVIVWFWIRHPPVLSKVLLENGGIEVWYWSKASENALSENGRSSNFSASASGFLVWISCPFWTTELDEQATNKPSSRFFSTRATLCIQGRRIVSWAQDHLRRLSNTLHFTIERWRCFDPCTSRQPQCVPVTPLMLWETTWVSRAAESIEKKKIRSSMRLAEPSDWGGNFIIHAEGLKGFDGLWHNPLEFALICAFLASVGP